MRLQWDMNRKKNRGNFPKNSTHLATRDFKSSPSPLYCHFLCPVTNRPPGVSHTGTPVLQRDRTGAMWGPLQRDEPKGGGVRGMEKVSRKSKTLPLNEDIIAWKTPAHNLNNTFQVFDITITACEERFDVNWNHWAAICFIALTNNSFLGRSTEG